MAKRTSRNGKKELDVKGNVMIIVALAVVYIIYSNLQMLLAAIFGSAILVIIILIVGAYFIIPRLGIAGLAALLNFGKK